MSYPIDCRLLRLTGELLATGSGTFGETEVRRLFAGALEDEALHTAEKAAVLVAYVTVFPRADAEARRRFARAVDALREDERDIQRWIVNSISASLLQRAVTLIAGRGRQHKVTHKDVLDLMSVAYNGGSGPSRAISPDEALAFLVIRELLDGRLAPDAQTLFNEICSAAREDGPSLGPSHPGSDGTAPAPDGGTRQCGACAGMGWMTCSSCSGHGYHIRSGSRTRYDGNIEYYQESIPCSCTSGRVRCGRCGGSGRVYLAFPLT